MAEKDDKEIKIFKLNRIKFRELYEDAIKYIKATYKVVGQQFNVASPFGQLLQVVLHLGRMIFYYIEDSITGLNIRTAYRPDQVKGLAMLAGHDTARAISARGACQIYFVDTGSYLTGQVCYIPNKTKVISKKNGLIYTLFFGADNGKITMNSANYLEANLIQGEIKIQSATGTGEPIQSFNFAERNYQEVDQYYVNVYVNGEPWEIHKSILDLGFNQKGCVLRTGINSGLDIFFGDGNMGAIPEEGSSIVIEYLVTAGGNSNILKDKEFNSSIKDDNWEWDGEGILQDGTTIKLNGNFKIRMTTDIIFGTAGEDLALTQLIAPHVSRSYVLASETNYKYFFQRMNMFSDIEVWRGSYTINGTSIMTLARDKAKSDYEIAHQNYLNAIQNWGENSEQVASAAKEDQKKLQLLQYAETKLNDNTYRDNTIYIFLVPDIKKRIATSDNYFICDESLFSLSSDEQANIINLINASGQRIITVENRIVQPKIAKFALNVQAKIWDNYDEEEVYTAGLKALSEYFLNRTRKDMIPISDIVSIFENEVPGIDSVRAQFVASAENTGIYGKRDGKPFDGIDEFGDILLTRYITDHNGQYILVRDILPLIRGGFNDKNGIYYSDKQEKNNISAFNLSFDITKSDNRQKTLTKYSPLT